MNPKMVVINWKDATSVDAWTNIEEITHDCHPIKTCGFLIGESDEGITVALSHDTINDDFSSFITIPKAWIISKEILSAKKRKA